MEVVLVVICVVCDPRSRGFHDIFRLVPRRHIHILAYNAGVRMGKTELVYLGLIYMYVF